jgi:hypothetical protein
MNNSNQLTESEISVTPANMILNPAAMQQITNFAHLMSQGVCTVPKHLQNNPADCLAITMQAARWNMDPFAVAQKTHIVSGNMGYEAQLINAVISSSKAIKGRFHYEYAGNWANTGPGGDAAIRTGAIIKDESEVTWGEWIFVGTVTTKNSPLWKTAPKQQAAYLAVKYWSRMYCPEVIMGVYTSDELQEAEPISVPERVINPEPEVVTEYPKDQFDKNFPKWEKAIESEKLTVDDVISKANSKYPLSDNQKKLIQGIGA